MKKSLWIALILMLVCILSFSACDQEDTPPNKGDVPSTQQPSDNNDDRPADNNNSGEANTQCQHTWGEWLTIKQATCKDEGQLIRVCGKCSVSEQTTVAKSETHTEVIDAAISATCTEDGKTEGKHCSVCGITLVEQTTIKAKGHTEVIDEAVAATCKTEGKTEGKHCSVCNDIIVKQTVIPKSGHTEVIDEAVTPTCTTEGKTEGKHCSVCGTIIVEQANVPKSNHTEVVDDAVPPTCTTEGKTEGKHCSVCKKVIVAQNSIDTVGHTYNNGACSVCKCMDIDSKNAEIATENQRYEQAISDNYSVYIDLVSETEDEISHRKSTYNISYVYNSDYCRQEMSEIEEEMTLLKKYIDAYSTGDWGDEVQAKLQRYKVQYAEYKEQYEKYEQMLIINGLYDYIDSYEENYNESLSELESIHEENLKNIDKKYECAVNGHTVVVDEAVAPTCTAIGKTEGSHCSNCGFVVIEQTTLESLGHTAVIDSAIKETCTMDGKTEGSHCSVCGDVIVTQEIIPMHHIEVIDPSVKETCTTNGKTEGKHCSACGEILVEQEIIEKHHTEVIDAMIESTCATEGKTEGKHCSVCDEILVAQSAIPMKPHVNGNWVSTDIESEINRLCCNCNTVLETKTVSAGLEYTLNNDGISYSVSGYGTCTEETTIIIPDVYNNLPVTGIAASAFWRSALYDEQMTNIVIPESVSQIGNNAFYGCIHLRNITIPDMVTSIGYGVFSGCTSLISITIGRSVNSIDKSAFNGCSALSHITFKGNIPSYSYSNISQLTTIVFDEGVTSIGSVKFYECTSLTSIEVSDNNNCYKSINGNLYSKDGTILIQYTASKQDVSFDIPDSVISIASYAFYRSTSLQSITIPNSVVSIGGNAFCNCTSLTSIIIGNSISKIESAAFQNCTSLENITIPHSVKSIGNYAFIGCTSLINVTFENTEGWQYAWNSNDTSRGSISSTTLANSTTAAQLLTSTYGGDYGTYYWFRVE